MGVNILLVNKTGVVHIEKRMGELLTTSSQIVVMYDMYYVFETVYRVADLRLAGVFLGTL